MERLRARDFHAALAFVRDVSAQPDLDAYARVVARELPATVPAQRISYNEIDRRTGVVRAVVRPVDPYPWLNGRLYREHPMMQRFARTGDGRAHKISDFFTRAEFEATAMYQEYYRLVGVEHQIAIFVTPAGVRSVGFAISRDLCDFDERDRLMLNLLRPHLVAAYDGAAATARLHAHMAVLARAADTAAAGIVLLNRGGGIDHATPQARQWLRYYFAGRGRPSVRSLPPIVGDWLARHKALESAPELTAPLEPFVVTRGDRRLVVRLTGAPGTPALLLEESCRDVDAAALKPLGLSAREREVLALVARGARNDEIGRTLGASPRTIAKHVERIHRKLGVDNRAAAAARAHAVMVAPLSPAGDHVIHTRDVD